MIPFVSLKHKVNQNWGASLPLHLLMKAGSSHSGQHEVVLITRAMTRRLLSSFSFEWTVKKGVLVRGRLIVMADFHGELAVDPHRVTHQVAVELCNNLLLSTGFSCPDTLEHTPIPSLS